MKFCLVIENSRSSPPSIDFRGNADNLWATESADGLWVGVIGSIYHPVGHSPLQWLALFEQSQIPVEDYPGRYLLIAYDRDSGNTRIWTDKYRLLGAFVAFTPQGIVISNSQEHSRDFLLRGEIDIRAVCDLLTLGYILPPLTLFKNVTMLTGFTVISGECRQVIQRDWREIWPNEEADFKGNTSDFGMHFQRSLESLLRYWDVRTFRISGGVDTRLISAFLPDWSKARLNFEVVCSPHLNETSDRDVIGAKRVTEVLQVPLEIMQLERRNSAYFAYIKEPRGALSGLYGGEFLGGILLTDIPGVKINSDPGKNISFGLGVDSTFKSDSVQRFQEDCKRYGARKLLTSIYLGAFRSSIYQSINFSWAEPYALGQLALSPFVEQEMLDYLLRIPVDVIRDYAFYRRLVREQVPLALRKIPFSSPIVQSGELPSFTEGVDPKNISPDSEQLETVVNDQVVDFLKMIGVDASPKSEICKNATTNSRLANLSNAFHFYGYLG